MESISYSSSSLLRLRLNLRLRHGCGLRLPCRTSFSTSHHHSNHCKADKENDVVILGEAWKLTLASFKQQAFKMHNISQQAYASYFKKTRVLLNATSQHLKVEPEKAKKNPAATENSTDPVKEVGDLNDISAIRDFCLGIPYGLLLSLGGFLSFMITGSIPAIRFGVILGGTLLALSISSLKKQKRGQSFVLPLKGQAAIAGILFLREIRLLSQRPSFMSCLTTLISAGMVAFYAYRIMQKKDSDLEHRTHKY